ncbi:MAG TPA: transcriptional regulator [Planctomycetes bacterium]|nr:transcriptional regulator [Planctomycetota bacterium]
MAYSIAELEAMLADIESDLVERKETFKGDAPRTVREAVCAFANDLPNHCRSGVVFIGAKEDGTPSALAVTDELLRQLADIKTDGNILPPPSLSVAKCGVRGADMAVITVAPADSPPVRYKGRIHIRVGPRRGIASAQDERILNEKRRHRDRPFDVQPVTSASIEDIDRRRFESEYLPAAVAREILEANDRSDEQRLAATKMILSAEEPCPTLLGLLVLGKTTRTFVPGAYVQFLRIEGTELDEPAVDEVAIDGPVADMIRRLDEKLAAHNRTRVDFTSGPREQRAPLYPVVALQQITRNAILHRTYESTHAPVRVTWYDDRIEILSPGGPYGAVTPENFGTPGLTDYRNPNLAEAMRVLGYVQKFGGGIVAARNALQKNGNPPPEFRVDQGHVLAVVRPPQ